MNPMFKKSIISIRTHTSNPFRTLIIWITYKELLDTVWKIIRYFTSCRYQYFVPLVPTKSKKELLMTVDPALIVISQTIWDSEVTRNRIRSWRLHNLGEILSSSLHKVKGCTRLRRDQKCLPRVHNVERSKRPCSELKAVLTLCRNANYETIVEQTHR